MGKDMEDRVTPNGKRLLDCLLAPEANSDDWYNPTEQSRHLLESTIGNGDSDTVPNLVASIEGPFDFNAESVWCKVCGCEERMISVDVPSLQFHLCCLVSKPAEK